MNLTIEEAHDLELQLKEKIRRLDPNHEQLKKYYPSTWKAIDGYYETLYGKKFFVD